jgi:LysM repeat protein
VQAPGKPGNNQGQPNNDGSGGTTAEGSTGPLHAASAIGNAVATAGPKGDNQGNPVQGDTIGGSSVGDGTVAADGGTSTSPAVGNSSVAPAPNYRVKHGDTLSGIAAAHGMSVGQLESLNPQIKNPNMIFPGQSVNLGKGQPVDGASGGGVVAGDPIGGILGSDGGTVAAAHGGDANAVQNSLDNARHPGNNGGVPAGTEVISAPASNAIGGGDFAGGAGGAGFPTTSTYPPVDQSLSQGESEEARAGRFRNLGKKIKGWGLGGKPPADPAQNAVYVDVPRNNTNPLDIKDGHGPHGGPHGPQ